MWPSNTSLVLCLQACCQPSHHDDNELSKWNWKQTHKVILSKSCFFLGVSLQQWKSGKDLSW
jgi:hypothetical protein